MLALLTDSDGADMAECGERAIARRAVSTHRPTARAAMVAPLDLGERGLAQAASGQIVRRFTRGCLEPPTPAFSCQAAVVISTLLHVTQYFVCMVQSTRATLLAFAAGSTIRLLQSARARRECVLNLCNGRHSS